MDARRPTPDSPTSPDPPVPDVPVHDVIPGGPTPPAPVQDSADSWRAWAEQHLARLEPALHATVADTATRLVTIDDELAPIGREIVDYVATGGKRLRPLLLLIGHHLSGADTDVLGPAVAIELVHTWALLHDDVIDADDTRRGRPTTHRGFAARHRDAGWSGDADRYGEAVAILAGDLIASVADEAFERADVPAAAMAAGRRDFAALRLEVIAGQVLDVHLAAVARSDLDRSLRVATLKSGRYTFTRPLQLGARLGDGDTLLVDRLGTVGDALGMAFQLRDDLLGVLGDPATTGKARGGDLREGKRTVLVAEAMARLDDADAARLDRSLGDPGLGDATIDDLVAKLEACGATRAVEDRIAALVDTAEAGLADLPAGRSRDAVTGLARILVRGWR